MKKQAYCILVHNDPVHFERLIDTLDHERNDIFVHVDKKSDISLFENVYPHKATLEFINSRTDVRWGDYSQIEAELSLLKASIEQGEKRISDTHMKRGG